MNENTTYVTRNSWTALRKFTDARIALGRAGVSLPTTEHLDFQLAHARARDAVHRDLNAPLLLQQLATVWPNAAVPCMELHSAAEDRSRYLQRPDLGRKLDVSSRVRLDQASDQHTDAADIEEYPYDLAFVVADGLSALAVEQNAAPFLRAMYQRMATEQWRVAPLCLVRQARVAIGDEIGQTLGAKAVVVLIGERPGLSSPDSMGLYMTWMPRVGLSDASRNCISNVRPAGLGYDEAAFKLHYLLGQSRQRKLSGVGLKDDTLVQPSALAAEAGNFLLLPRS